MNMRLSTLAASLVLLAAGPANSYEVETHSDLTWLALQRSTLATDASLLTGLGLAPIGASQLSYGGQSVTIEQAMRFGALNEDAGQRPLNHFFDIQFNSRNGRGLTIAGSPVGVPSPLWALEDWTTVTSDIPQDTSYRDAQQTLRLALSSADPVVRKGYFSTMFEALGRIVHHVQDMGQPEHVRNDSHLVYLDPSAYEAFAKASYPPAALSQLIAQSSYPVPNLLSPRDFFYTPGLTNRYIGMAEFTSQNFVSKDTGFRISTNGSIFQNPLEPLPNGVNVDGSQKRLQTTNIQLQDRQGSTFQVAMDFIVGKIFDEFTGASSGEIKLAGSSLLNPALSRVPSANQIAIKNRLVFAEEAPILLPRAASFSAGMINNFFRVKVNLRRDAATSRWNIDNLSGQQLSGDVQIYTEENSGFRAAWGSPFPVNLGPGQSVEAPIAEPPNPARLVAVFAGRVGAEVPPGVGGLLSVGGKVVPYEPLPIPCPATFSRSGSSEGLSQLVELGNVAGTYEIEFEAYSIPDGLVVRKGSSSGALVASTLGPVSGYQHFNKSHSPAAGESTKIHVRVDGNPDTATLWVLTVGCPNQTLTNATRTAKRVQIQIGKETQQGTSCEAGYSDVRVDGVSVGTISYQSQVSGFVAPTVSTGPDHSVQFVTTVTSASSPYGSCSGLGRYYYIDSAGTHYLSSSGGLITVN